MLDATGGDLLQLAAHPAKRQRRHHPGRAFALEMGRIDVDQRLGPARVDGDSVAVLETHDLTRQAAYLDILTDEAERYTVLTPFETDHAVVADPAADSDVEWLGQRLGKTGEKAAFLDGPIEGDWPYLWIDATYVKVRQNGRIVSVAVIIAVGVNSDGRREVLGMDIGSSEAEPFWTAFLRKLMRRALRGVKLVISDAHEGIKAAVSKLLCATWQRCRVHFMPKLNSAFGDHI
jgi:hypothetical protein